MTIVPMTPHITMKCQNSMDLESPDSTWLTPKQKPAKMTEQMTYLRTEDDPGGDLPSLSESFAIVDERGNSIGTETDEALIHG